MKVFAQDIVKEHLVDQKQVKDPKDYSTILKEFRSLDSTSTKVYMKDPGNFLNLRNAEFNSKKRKQIQNRVVAGQARSLKQPHRLPKIQGFSGSKMNETIYEGMRHKTQEDVLTNQLHEQLMGVMLSIKTDHFYQSQIDQETGAVKQESEADQQKRLEKAMDSHMKVIDTSFDHIFLQEYFSYKQGSRLPKSKELEMSAPKPKLKLKPLWDAQP